MLCLRQAKKMVTKAAWWKNPRYGKPMYLVNKTHMWLDAACTRMTGQRICAGFHFKKSVSKVAKVQGMKHAANKDLSKTQDLNAFKKLGLA